MTFYGRVTIFVFHARLAMLATTVDGRMVYFASAATVGQTKTMKYRGLFFIVRI
jgi:hypothetical protein